MSRLALLWVREYSPARGRAYQVLEALASYVHEHDNKCRRGCDREGIAWPSVPTIAADLRCSVRSVQYALRGLEAAGVIEREPTGRSANYRLPMPTPTLPDEGVSEAVPDPVPAPVGPAAAAVSDLESCISEVQILHHRGADSAPDFIGSRREHPDVAPPALPQASKGMEERLPAPISPPLRGCSRHLSDPDPGCVRCQARSVLAEGALRAEQTRADARAATGKARAGRRRKVPVGSGRSQYVVPEPEPLAAGLAEAVPGAIRGDPRGRS